MFGGFIKLHFTHSEIEKAVQFQNVFSIFNYYFAKDFSA